MGLGNLDKGKQTDRERWLSMSSPEAELAALTEYDIFEVIGRLKEIGASPLEQLEVELPFPINRGWRWN